MTFKNTLIQINSSEETVLRIDGEILPATIGGKIYVEGRWYKTVDVTTYCRRMYDSSSVEISETIWVE